MPKNTNISKKLLNFGVTRPRPLQLRIELNEETTFEPISLTTTVKNQSRTFDMSAVKDSLSEDENSAPSSQNNKQSRFTKWFLSQNSNAVVKDSVVTSTESNEASLLQPESSQTHGAEKVLKTKKNTSSKRQELKTNITHLSVAIMYEKSYLTKKQAHDIRKEIWNCISTHEGRTRRPYFLKCFYDDGALKLTCVNEFSKNWLQQYLESSVSPETNDHLMFIEQKDFVPLLKAKLFLRDDRIESTEYEIKSRLQKYNKKYDIDSWFIYNIRVQQSKRFMLKGLHLILGLPPKEVERITCNGCRVTYGIATGLLQFYGLDGLQNNPPDISLVSNNASESNVPNLEV